MPDEIRFYHLQKTSAESALVKLLPQSLTRYGASVVTAPKSAIRPLNQALWTHTADDDFLPHGAKGEDSFPDQQPIWLNDDAENPNGAKTLFCLTPLPEPEKLNSFALVCLLFSDHDAALLQAARTAWATRKQAGDKLCYYRENTRGAWEKQDI